MNFRTFAGGAGAQVCASSLTMSRATAPRPMIARTGESGNTASRLTRAVIALLLTSSVAWSAASAQETPELGSTVETLLDYARANNPEYAAMRLEAEAATERVFPAGALPDPVFRTELRDVTNAASGAGASLLPNRVGSTRYLVMQNIPWFGKRDLKREVAQSTVEEAKGKADTTWAELAARIETAYARYHQATQSVRLFREIVDLLDRLERIAQVRYASGLSPQQDVIRAQTERTAAQTEQVVMESEVIGMRAMLNSLVNRAANAALAEPRSVRPLPAPAALEFSIIAEQVRARNPELFSDEARIRGAEKTRALVHANRYPDFSLGISPIQMGDRFNEWELMVEINIPLQQKARRHQEREAETMLSAARLRRDATISRILGDLGRSLAALEAARRTEILTSNSLLPQADLTFQAALVAYETGRADFATLLDAQRQIRQAKLIRIRAQAEAHVRLSEIERLVGERL